eukprot:6293511-Amphidinium_carterae.1
MVVQEAHSVMYMRLPSDKPYGKQSMPRMVHPKLFVTLEEIIFRASLLEPVFGREVLGHLIATTSCVVLFKKP